LKTIIIGLGNPSFSDDGVGLLVTRSITNKIANADISIVETSTAGLDILDIIADYEKAIIVDAVQTENGIPGSIYRFDLNELSFLEEGSSHNIDLLTSVNLGKKLGLSLPNQIIIFGIESQNISEPKEECTPRVSAAIPLCIEKIINELQAEPKFSN
jgi:hydrogenase maturation protease